MRPIGAPGHMGVDYEQRVDFARLRDYRINRATEALRATECGAFLLFDLHYDIGSVPADGIHNAFQELLGTKRAAYALLTGEAIDARKALEYGLVDQVLGRRFPEAGASGS